MTTYGFSFRFRMPANVIIEGSEDGLEFSLNEIPEPLLLKHVVHSEHHQPGTPEEYFVRGSKFPTKEAALKCGQLIRLATALYGVESQRGSDVGQEEIKQVSSRFGGTSPSGYYGVDVYPEDKPKYTAKLEVTGGDQPTIKRFVERVTDHYRNDVQLSKPLPTAIEIYNSSMFAKSQTMRFLNLIMVIEVLAEEEFQPESIQSLVDKWKEQVDSLDLPKKDKGDLKSRLGYLKYESIKQACFKLIARYTDNGSAELFKKCYDKRSNLLHHGQVPDYEFLYDLEETIWKVLLKSIENHSTAKFVALPR